MGPIHNDHKEDQLDSHLVTLKKLTRFFLVTAFKTKGALNNLYPGALVSLSGAIETGSSCHLMATFFSCFTMKIFLRTERNVSMFS